MGGKGGDGGGAGIPHGETLGNLFAAQLLGASANRMPWMRPALQHGDINKSYGELFGGAPLNPFQSTAQSSMGPGTSQAYGQLYGGYRPPIRSNVGTYKGAGNLVSVPGQTGFMAQSDPEYEQSQKTAKAFGLTPDRMINTQDIMGLISARKSPFATRIQAAQTLSNMQDQASQLERDGGIPPSHGQYRGGGAMSPLPGTNFTTPKFQAPATPTYSLGQMPDYTPPVNAYAPQTAAIQPLKVPGQAYQIMGQQAVQQIGQANKQAQQNLMNQMAARGLGRSGLQLQAAADLYNRGAGQQMSDLAQNLAAQRMQAEFGEAQQARGLEAQRQMGQAGLQQNAEAQALQRALGLGQLGISERGQSLSELAQQQREQDVLMSILGGVSQAGMAAQAAQGQSGGKK